MTADMDAETREAICKAIITVGAVGGSVVLTPAILIGMGFGAGGVVPGSIAAQLMSWFGAGWLITLLHSIGAAVLGWLAQLLWHLFGAYWAKTLSTLCNINVTFSAEALT